jgi:hypothetical protein
MERKNQITFNSKDNEKLLKLLHVMEAEKNDVDNQSISKNLFLTTLISHVPKLILA